MVSSLARDMSYSAATMTSAWYATVQRLVEASATAGGSAGAHIDALVHADMLGGVASAPERDGDFRRLLAARKQLIPAVVASVSLQRTDFSDMLRCVCPGGCRRVVIDGNSIGFHARHATLERPWMAGDDTPSLLVSSLR